jgi:hypothetical protein
MLSKYSQRPLSNLWLLYPAPLLIRIADSIDTLLTLFEDLVEALFGEFDLRDSCFFFHVC